MNGEINQARVRIIPLKIMKATSNLLILDFKDNYFIHTLKFIEVCWSQMLPDFLTGRKGLV